MFTIGNESFKYSCSIIDTYGSKMEQELEIVLVLLKYKELHVRGASKILNQPHANISRAMKKLLSENVVDFRFQGRNKTFRLKKSIESTTCIRMAESFKLIKLIRKYQFLGVTIEQILAETRQNLVLIFGSFAKFSANNDSDIDIYIETTDRKTKEKIENIYSRLSVKIGKFDKDNLLIKEIIKDHVILKGVEYFYEKNKILN